MKIEIETTSSKYPVVLESGALSQLGEYLPHDYDSLHVLVDEVVWRQYETYFAKEIQLPYEVCVLPKGEQSKSLGVYEEAMSFLLNNLATRKSVILAFGGGAIGDLAGFVAATYMRGIAFIQIPTTILAHDSAVGGKTGINHTLGKNMIGAFHQPLAVIYDTEFMKTLPMAEVRSGFSELFKHALLSDADWAHTLMSIHSPQMLQSLQWEEQLAKGILVKANIVKQDEFEVHERKFLNLGHTYGHAIEAAAGFGQIRHGEAVAIGLVVTLLLSKQKELAKKWFSQMLDLEYPVLFVKDLNFEDILHYMKKDKKNQHHQLHFVLLEEIGTPHLAIVSEEEVKQAHKQLIGWLREEIE